MKIINKELLELLSKQLLFAAQNLNVSDTDSDHEALIDQLGSYGQACPECEDQGLQEASDDWVVDFIWNIAHNKELLGLFLHCAYLHHSKQDVDNLFRQKEREFCESADEEEMHFHLTGEHHEDCECLECVSKWEGVRNAHDYDPMPTAADFVCAKEINVGDCPCAECRKEVGALEIEALEAEKAALEAAIAANATALEALDVMLEPPIKIKSTLPLEDVA